MILNFESFFKQVIDTFFFSWIYYRVYLNGRHKIEPSVHFDLYNSQLHHMKLANSAFWMKFNLLELRLRNKEKVVYIDFPVCWQFRPYMFVDIFKQFMLIYISKHIPSSNCRDELSELFFSKFFFFICWFHSLSGG